MNAVLGAWMIAAPFVLDYTINPARTWSAIVAGFIIVIFASQSAAASPASMQETYTTDSAYDEGTGAAPYVPYMWPYAYGGRPFGPGGWASRDAQGWRREDIGQYRGRGPRGWRRTDAQMREAIAERMADSGDLDASDVEIEVSGGTVTLRGVVSTRTGKRLAEDIAESVGGVQDVHNELTVGVPGVRRAA